MYSGGADGVPIGVFLVASVSPIPACGRPAKNGNCDAPSRVRTSASLSLGLPAAGSIFSQIQKRKAFTSALGSTDQQDITVCRYGTAPPPSPNGDRVFPDFPCQIGSASPDAENFVHAMQIASLRGVRQCQMHRGQC